MSARYGCPAAGHENAFAGKGFRRAVMVGMNLLAGEGRGAGKGRLRILRIPVVTVGDQYGVVPLGARSPGIPPPDRDVPATSRRRPGPGHLGPELNPPAEPD